MKLRYTLSLALVLLTMLPLVLFWVWPHSALLQSEVDEVKESHLLLARNMGSALERYHRDVVSTFQFIVGQLDEGRQIDADAILNNLEFRHICYFTPDGSRLLAEASPADQRCPEKLPPERRELAFSMSGSGDIELSQVMPGPDGENVIFIVQRCAHALVIGAIYTRYFQTLARQVAFGIRGHAAIVDQAGNVLAHPSRKWVAERRNIAGIEPVSHMLTGGTGVAHFFSPALKRQMVAGYTSVPGAGWGVMIPQPVDELRQKVVTVRTSALSVMALGLVLASLVALIVSYWIARPLEQLSRAAAAVAAGRWANLEHRSWVPRELHDFEAAFNSMVERLRCSMIRINQLAYVDSITDLANRNYFRQRACRYLAEDDICETGGAIVFLDLDGFKSVNDELGHDVGDVVLAEVGARLTDLFDITPVRRFCETDPVQAAIAVPPEPLLARLGGDEFALLLPQLRRGTELARAASKILASLSEPFEVGDHVMLLSASIGLSRFPDDGCDLASLLKKADTAMYAAKRDGKDRFVIYDDGQPSGTLSSQVLPLSTL